MSLSVSIIAAYSVMGSSIHKLSGILRYRAVIMGGYILFNIFGTFGRIKPMGNSTRDGIWVGEFKDFPHRQTPKLERGGGGGGGGGEGRKKE